jgi:rhamnulokinase
VLSGPVEATVVGNILVQAMAGGNIGSLGEAREVVARSFPLEEYVPVEPDRWEQPYARFRALIGETPAGRPSPATYARSRG